MYHLSLLKERIRKNYTGIGITVPGSWDLELIAERLKIKVHYKNRSSATVKLLGMACIILDSRIYNKSILLNNQPHHTFHLITLTRSQNQYNAFLIHPIFIPISFAIPTYK